MVWEKKLLGITKDHELKFDSHILAISSKANKKLSISCRHQNNLKFQLCKGYSLSHFLKYNLNIAFLYEWSVVDLRLTKSAVFTKELIKFLNSKFKNFLIKGDSLTIHH